MYKTILFLSLMSGVLLHAQENSSENPGMIGSSKYFEFFSLYGFNLHHFLYQEALLQKEVDSTTISPDLYAQFSEGEHQTLQEVITFYQEEMLDMDLRTSSYMANFRSWIIQYDELPTKVPNDFINHLTVLKKVDQVYRHYFWPKQQAQNSQIFKQNKDLILKTEEAAVERLSLLTRQNWQDEKVRVDLVYHGKSTAWNLRSRPYTSLGPTHIVMNTAEEADSPHGNWLELLYHESSHNLIGGNRGFVGGTILDVSDVLGKKPARSLWHSYLFYFSGVVTRELLEENGIENYSLYMVRNRVFASHFPFLDKYLPAYISRKTSLYEATKHIFEDFE